MTKVAFFHFTWYSASLLKNEQHSFHQEPDRSNHTQEFCLLAITQNHCGKKAPEKHLLQQHVTLIVLPLTFSWDKSYKVKQEADLLWN